MTRPEAPREDIRSRFRSEQWADLRTRLGWGAVLLAAGILLLVSSGIWLQMGVSLVSGAMMWELAGLTGWRHPEFHSPRHPLLIGILSGLVLLVMLSLPGCWPALMLLVPVLAGLPGTHAHERRAYVLFTIAILGAGYALVVLHDGIGLATILWIVATVVLSDVLGYFVGRKLGGPRFWPSISPKKTWSGTLAGWAGAIVLAAGIWLGGGAGPGILLAGPLLAVAGQFGDIAESWLKRRVGAKDSSHLIPGHGGVMDRFDAMSGALLLALILGFLGILPEIGG